MSSNASSLFQCPHSENCRIRIQILLVFASPECHWLQGGCRILAKSRNWHKIFSDSLMLLFIWCYHQELTACFTQHFTFKLYKGYLLCWCYIVCKKDAHMEMKKHWLPLGFPAFSIHFPKQPRDSFSPEKYRNEKSHFLAFIYDILESCLLSLLLNSHNNNNKYLLTHKKFDTLLFFSMYWFPSQSPSLNKINPFLPLKGWEQRRSSRESWMITKDNRRKQSRDWL